MPDYAGIVSDEAGLSQAKTARAYPAGLSTQATTMLEQAVPDPGDAAELPALGPDQLGTYAFNANHVQRTPANYLGDTLGSAQQGAFGDPFFEEIIVVPDSIALGNVLSSQQRNIQIYNASKKGTNSWVSFTNNAGTGLSITNLPSLPTDLNPQDEINLILQVDADGAPIINGTLDFTFNLYTIMVTITGQRVVIFPFAPEGPLTEELEFLTDILEHLDGSEQRVKMRKNPRQSFAWRTRRDGDDRRYLENQLYDWQTSVFGVGMWHEATLLTQAATASDLTINVQTTDYADYRVGGLAMVIDKVNRKLLDALEIDSFTGTTITFTSGLNNSFPAGAFVMPMRTCFAQQEVGGSRAIVNLGQKDIRFRVIDNDSNLGDVSAWSSFNSKVLLDDPNRVQREIQDRMLKRLYPHDGDTGAFSQESRWDRGKRITQKGWTTSSRQELWELRQLLHALGGRQTSFYLPTFYDELVLALPLTNGSDSATFENVGYNRFAQDRRVYVRFLLTDGTVIIKEVLSSSEVDEDSETITFTDTWSQDYAIDEVERIDYIETMRLDSDTITIVHVNGSGYAGVIAPVREVFGE